MLLTIAPHAVVNAPIGPHVCTEARLFVVLVLALVATAILPDVDAASVHLSVLPLALIAGLVLAVYQLSVSRHHAITELTCVDLVIAQVPGAAWSLLSFLEVALILCAVSIYFDSVAVLAIHQQATFVAVLELTVRVLSCHLTLALSHALVERALDGCAICHDLFDTFACGDTSDESSIVFVAIGPLDFSTPIWNQFIRPERISSHLA